MASEGKNLIGVDIGSSSIKVCVIEENRKGARSLVHVGQHLLPQETIVDGHIINSNAIVDGLEKLFHGMRRRHVALRASGHSVIIKKITLPLMTRAELEEQIPWEAEQHIPFDLAEVYIDYQLLRRHEDAGQMEVLLVAAKREEIRDLTNLVAEARLVPMVVDLDAFAVQNIYEQGYGLAEEEVVVLVHSGASLTTVNILAGGTTAFTRDITRGGHAITEEIQRSLGISREEAEAYKCGGEGEGIVPREVPEMVTQMADQLAGEIQRSLDFYLATSGGQRFDRIVCSGGTANIPVLREMLADRTQASVEVMDPFRVASPNLKRVSPVEVHSNAAQITVAMGLALRKEREQRA